MALFGGLLDSAEFFGWVVFWRFCALKFTTRQLLGFAARCSNEFNIHPIFSASEGVPAVSSQHLEAYCRLLEGLDRDLQRIPKVRCLHTALAARVWLARRGIDSEVVVGMFKAAHLAKKRAAESESAKDKTAQRESIGRESVAEFRAHAWIDIVCGETQLTLLRKESAHMVEVLRESQVLRRL